MQCDLSNNKCKQCVGVVYNRCTVGYHTHAIKECSENDFICASKINALFSL